MGVRDRVKVNIVTHCYAARLPQYAVFLRAQISSLILYRAACDVTLTVCYSPDDKNTVTVLRDMSNVSKDIYLKPKPMSESRLFRRAIGRDASCMPDSDIVWFTDADYLFGDGCLDWLATWWRSEDIVPKLVWPKVVMLHKSHEAGDAFWRDNLHSDSTIHPNLHDFEPASYNRAIGGIQIVDGYYAYKKGYLRDTKWQKEVDSTKPFACFRDDVAFRHQCASHGVIKAADIKNVYRLRHTEVTYK